MLCRSTAALAAVTIGYFMALYGKLKRGSLAGGIDIHRILTETFLCNIYVLVPVCVTCKHNIKQ